jgi:hypothetical protein
LDVAARAADASREVGSVGCSLRKKLQVSLEVELAILESLLDRECVEDVSDPENS